MKRCFKCSRDLPASEFYRHPMMHDGTLNKCKECTKRDVSARYHATRAERADYELRRKQTLERKSARLQYQKNHRARYPEKAVARAKTIRAIRSGRLEKSPCVRCGNPVVEAHHPDYNQPLLVVWLCRSCHYEAHGKSAIKR